jgi:isocitrate dehydrogenase (NAD+)
MKYRITLIPGDGIGPEVTDAARQCVESVGDRHNFSIEWEERMAGETAREREGSILPGATFSSIRKNKVALKGPIATPIGVGFRSVNVELRMGLDLFANVRPAKTIPGVKSRYKNVDLVVIRENTEDLYTGIEFDKGKDETKELIEFALTFTGKRIKEDSAISFKTISVSGSRRIVKFAFDYALANERKKITAVHKANILKFTDGLFMREAQSVAMDYKRRVEYEDKIVDNICMQLVTKPELYDVLVCPNLYGDIISDLTSGLVGGSGMAPSANIGLHYAVFEPVHGSAPKYKGKNKVNPSACILSAAMMLDHIGEQAAAHDIRKAVAAVIKEGKNLTYDLKDRNPVGTKQMTKAIIEKIRG